jgi:hypothetical protein
LFIGCVVIPTWGFIVTFWPLVLGLIVVLVWVAIFLPQRNKEFPSQDSGEALSNHGDKIPATLRNPARSRSSENWRNGITSYNTDQIIGRDNPTPVRERACNPGLEGGLSKEAAATIVALTRSALNARRKDAPLSGLCPNTSSGRKEIGSQRLTPTKNSAVYAPPGVPTRGLIIKEEWLNKILQGRKTMELRKKPNLQLGLIALIKKGSGKIYGIAEIVESIGPMSFDEFRSRAHEHAVELEMLREIFEMGWKHGWCLKNIVPLKSPVGYIHTRGVMSQVILDPGAIEALSRQLARV